MKPLLSHSKLLATQRIEADFAVIGGGMAGVCAALAAARNGCRAVLVQDRSVLGGNASSEIKMHIVGADCHGSRPGARESGLIEELRLEDAARNPYRCYPQWDLLLYEKVKAEPLITLLLDSTFLACHLDANSGAIHSLTVLRNSTDDVFEIHARYFADCSGDSRLGAEAGADFQMGREDQTKYGESLAPETADQQTLGSSILITGRRHEAAQSFVAPPWIRRFTKADLNHRPIHSYEYGYWWFEWGGQLNTIKDNESIRHELLRIALGIWDYVKNSGDHPDSSHWALDWVGAIPGKRESRRLLGPRVLTQNDLQSGRIFPDAVAYGGWAIDLHPPSGVDARDEPPFTPTHLDQLYTIPLRSLISRNIPNLMFAGRNLSASHVAFASTRVMATCAVAGQAVGTAAAVALDHNASLADLTSGPLLEDLQQTLLKNDAFIPTAKNSDPCDFARRCKNVSASSSLENCPPEAIVDGISRSLNFRKLGSWADGGTHCWTSASLPAWIELQFPAETKLQEIHLTFDSGFQRELILSASDHITSKGIRGPQPETVKHYRILLDGQVVAEETNNHQRKRIHGLERSVAAKTLRVEVLATHGLEHARIFEIRAY
jgi:hypothetical protein